MTSPNGHRLASRSSSQQAPVSLAPLIAKLPHLVIVNSMSNSHGIAELWLGYPVIPALRARQVRAGSLCLVNAAAEFCGLTNRSGRTALCAG